MDQNPDFERLVADGLAASLADQREAALALFTRAGELMPGSGVPHFLIASEHASAGDFAAAEHAFANAVLLSPDFPLARYQLGLLQFSSQRSAMALLTWQPLLSLPQEDALLHFVRGFAELANDGFDAALRHFRTGLACAGANPAVCSDVRQLMDAIQELQATSRSDAAGSDADAAPGAQHVLLGGYARGLH
ncbi:MAG TPA: hypothetical protein VHL79_18345 [Ramlibacter sp.]|jgi:tetratricopeptide (TPR) repeat protein|nr:hypothetical protein [Ramlibacter sp.]